MNFCAKHNYSERRNAHTFHELVKPPKLFVYKRKITLLGHLR